MDYIISSMDLLLKPSYCIFLVIVFFLFLFVGGKAGKRANRIPLSLLGTYTGLIFLATLIVRTTNHESYQLIPFWSYYEIIVHHDMILFWEDLLNVAMMLPVGFLLPAAFRQIQLRTVLIIAIGMECFIEIMQFVFERGLAEWDDVIHGAIGTLIGYGLFKMFISVRRACTGLDK